jgi:hypothetical protein
VHKEFITLWKVLSGFLVFTGWTCYSDSKSLKICILYLLLVCLVQIKLAQILNPEPAGLHYGDKFGRKEM